MKTTIFSTHKFEEPYLVKANNGAHQLKLLESRLTEETAVLATGSEAISLFTSDDALGHILEKLSVFGVKYIALRTAGFNHVDIEKAAELNIKVARVPAYSPYAIAEHAMALILALNLYWLKYYMVLAVISLYKMWLKIKTSSIHMVFAIQIVRPSANRQIS